MKTKPMKMILTCGAMLFALLLVDSCSKDDPAVVVDKAALTVAIDAANNLLTTTHEGVATGNYLRGSQLTLAEAVAIAQVIADLPEVSAATVAGAKANLDAAIAAYGAQAVVPIDPTNLVGQWTFDEITVTTSGSVVKDYSGNSHDGAITAGHSFWNAGGAGIFPSLTADRYGNSGKAIHFDKGGNVEIPYNTALNPGQMSISLWAKPDVNTPIVNNQYFIAMNRWNGYKFNFQDTPRAFFTATYDDPTANPPKVKACCYDKDQNIGIAPQGSWHHYVVTFGGGHEVFYIDGTLVYDWGAIPAEGVPGTISTLATPVNLVFGQDLPTSVYVTAPDSSPNFVDYGGFYIGAMDEVRIYKSVLTASQVTSIYNLEKP